MGQRVDGRSDLYSLGAMFYELVTGVQPYQAEDSAQLLGMHVNGAVPRFIDAMARYQPLLDGLMAKNPNHRFESARELLRALPFYISNVSGSERTKVAAQH
jgi:serine/threonine protein kinase